MVTLTAPMLIAFPISSGVRLPRYAAGGVRHKFCDLLAIPCQSSTLSSPTRTSILQQDLQDQKVPITYVHSALSRVR